MSVAFATSGGLVLLPCDALVQILAQLDQRSLYIAACVCRTLHKSVCTDDLWRMLFEDHYAVAIARIFRGAVPMPSHLSWRSHYFEFHDHWLAWAYEKHQCVLVEIHGCVYDLTDYVVHHPGGADMITGASGYDATRAYDAVGHSSNAERLLAGFLVGRRSDLLPHRHRPLHSNQSKQGTLSLLVDGLRSGSRRQKVWNVLHLGVASLLHDLTEGRPDRRRLSPAIGHILLAAIFGQITASWTIDSTPAGGGGES